MLSCVLNNKTNIRRRPRPKNIIQYFSSRFILDVFAKRIPKMFVQSFLLYSLFSSLVLSTLEGHNLLSMIKDRSCTILIYVNLKSISGLKFDFPPGPVGSGGPNSTLNIIQIEKTYLINNKAVFRINQFSNFFYKRWYYQR